MGLKNLWIVAILFGGFIEDIHVYDNREEADADYDACAEEVDPETDDLKMFLVSLSTLEAHVTRSWFREHPEL